MGVRKFVSANNCAIVKDHMLFLLSGLSCKAETFVVQLSLVSVWGWCPSCVTMQNVNLNGMDAGGITRNITRDRKARKLLTEGKTTDRSWSWVVNSLVKKGGNVASQCNVNMLDTIICRTGMPEAWYFTSRGGTIMKKDDRNLTKKAVLERYVCWHLLPLLQFDFSRSCLPPPLPCYFSQLRKNIIPFAQFCKYCGPSVRNIAELPHRICLQ